MTYYKVVRNIDGKLLSFNGNKKTYSIQNRVYIPNRWTIANPKLFQLGYGLAVFCSKEKLFIFENRTSHHYFINDELHVCTLEYWKCKISVPSDWKPAHFRLEVIPKTFKKFIDKINNHYNYKICWPAGTVLVEKVMLTERIR